MKIGDLCVIYKAVIFDEAQITGIDPKTGLLEVTTASIHGVRNTFKVRVVEYGDKCILLIC